MLETFQRLLPLFLQNNLTDGRNENYYLVWFYVTIHLHCMMDSIPYSTPSIQLQSNSNRKNQIKIKLLHNRIIRRYSNAYIQSVLLEWFLHSDANRLIRVESNDQSGSVEEKKKEITWSRLTTEGADISNPVQWEWLKARTISDEWFRQMIRCNRKRATSNRVRHPVTIFLESRCAPLPQFRLNRIHPADRQLESNSRQPPPHGNHCFHDQRSEGTGLTDIFGRIASSQIKCKVIQAFHVITCPAGGAVVQLTFTRWRRFGARS